MEQLSVAEDKLSKVMARLLGVDVFAKKLEMDEERFVPEGLGYKTDLFEEEEKVSFQYNDSLYEMERLLIKRIWFGLFS